MKNQCHGIRTSWPWKGYRCGAVGKYEVDGKKYCANHFPAALKRYEELKKDMITN